MRKIRVVLADDHTVVRQGLRALLSAEEDMEVVGEAENGRQTVQLVKRLLPDVAVLDIAMPVLNGLEATRQITGAVPSTKVIILSSYSDDGYVQQVAEIGAVGYLVKHTAADDLVKAIHEAHRGSTFFSPEIGRRLQERGAEGSTRARPCRKWGNHLTTRQAEVLQLIAEGRANKQIAAELGISIKTVEKHRQRLMDTLGLHDVASLTRHAVARGMVEHGAASQAA